MDIAMKDMGKFGTQKWAGLLERAGVQNKISFVI